jgi:hypothetical protein
MLLNSRPSCRLSDGETIAEATNRSGAQTMQNPATRMRAGQRRSSSPASASFDDRDLVAERQPPRSELVRER